MKTSTVGNLKTHFSEVLDDVKNGEEYTIEFGKRRDKIAVIIPYKEYKKKNKIKLGLLDKKGKITLKDDFKISENDFLTL